GPDDLAPFLWADNGLYVVSLDRAAKNRHLDRHWVVRRFVEGRGGTPRELAKARVNAERRAAYEHEYHTGCGLSGTETIPRTLRRMRPFVQDTAGMPGRGGRHRPGQAAR